MNRIYGKQTIRCSPETIFNYVTTFGTWPKWYPITWNVAGDIEHPIEPASLGTDYQCIERVVLCFIPFTFYWKCLEKDFPKKFVFTGTSNVGGQATITYTFTPTAGGTEFQRELLYCQTNLLMKLADWLLVRRQIQKISDQAIANVRKILEKPAA